MIAASVRDYLTEPVHAIVDHAGSVFARDLAKRRDVDITVLNLLRVPDEELYAVRIHCPQISGYQRIGDQRGGLARNLDGFKYRARKLRERTMGNQKIIVGTVHELLKVALMERGELQ